MQCGVENKYSMSQVYFNIISFKSKDTLKDYYKVVDYLISKNVNFIRYIKNPYKLCDVEGFFTALEDNFDKWHLHHIAGEYINKQELIKRGLYYEQEPWLLKFVRETEHRRIHAIIT